MAGRKKTGKKARGTQSRGGGSIAGGRGLTVKVKTAKGRKISSTRWLQRQLNDPYVAAAQADGYRSRAAYKLIEIDDKFHILKKGAKVLDLGAAPGGWTQVAVDRVGSRGAVIAVDLQEIDPIPGAVILHGDATEMDVMARIVEALDGSADVVLSDMSPAVTGHSRTDHLRIIGLCETAYEIARDVLADGGTFVAKVFQGGAGSELLNVLKKDFTSVRHIKPPASRKESPEMYVIATNFRGGGKKTDG